MMLRTSTVSERCTRSERVKNIRAQGYYLVSVLTRAHTTCKASSFHIHLTKIEDASIEYLDDFEPSILDTCFLSTVEIVKNLAQ
jgi:hypothetical protein